MEGKCYLGTVPLCCPAAACFLISLVSILLHLQLLDTKQSPGRNAFTKWWNGFYTNDSPVHKNKLPCKKFLKQKKKVILFLLRKSLKSFNPSIYQQVFTDTISKLFLRVQYTRKGKHYQCLLLINILMKEVKFMSRK